MNANFKDQSIRIQRCNIIKRLGNALVVVVVMTASCPVFRGSTGDSGETCEFFNIKDCSGGSHAFITETFCML